MSPHHLAVAPARAGGLGRWAALAACSVVAALLGVVPVASPAAGAVDEVIDLTFPVDPTRVTYSDDYLAPRSGGRTHHATDLLCCKMLPIHAAMGGTVTRMPLVDDQYGYRLSILGDDGRTYSYVHLNNDTPGTDDGQGTPEEAYAPGVALQGRVERGQHIAYMGDSGNAESTTPHLHLSITEPDGTTLNPYPSLRAAEERGDVPATSVAVPPAAVEPPPPPPPAPALDAACPSSSEAATFSDVGPTNVHHRAVECLAALAVTEGVGSDRYAPADQVTRLQMASFTVRLLAAGGVALPSSPPDAFDDDEGTVHELAVNQLSALGVIRGDTGEIGRDLQGRVAMKRDRMAAWMARAYALIAGEELPVSSTDHFTDDAALHHADINRLTDAGIIQGASPGRYAPRDGVRRDQMASYLARALAVARA